MPGAAADGGALHVWPEPWAEAAEGLRVPARLEMPGGSLELWYRVPAERRPWLVESGDPFAVAALLPAMRRGADLVVHAPVSPSLLANLQMFMEAWVSWGRGRYRYVEILADSERETAPARPSASAVCAFSGGLDSAFSLHRHRKGLCGRLARNVEAGLFVHGFDIPLEQADAFARAAARIRTTLASLGVELVEMATNLRVLGPGADWDETHGTALASCLLLLGRRFDCGIIPGTQAVSEYDGRPWGSNPLTDPLLSSAGFRILHDGLGHPRGYKMRAVAGWPEAFDALRVCWRGRPPDRNCGRCAKCVLTLLGLRVQGLGVPASFPADPTDETIRSIPHAKPEELAHARVLLAQLAEAGYRASWVEALQAAVRRLEAPPRAPAAARLRRWLRGGA